MFNIFKMYCYKMFRQKSLYVIWVIMLFFEFISLQMTDGGFAEHSIDMGGFYILFAAIFPTIFFSVDITSGFIKNYAGSVSHRSKVMAARVAMTVVQNLLTLAVMFISLYIADSFSGRGLGEISFIFKYYVCTFLAGLACSFVGVMVTELTRKTVVAMILTISVGTGLISQISSLISLLVSNSKFDIGHFMVTSTFTQITLDSADTDFYATIAVAVCYIVCSVFISVISIEKRDIV
ncbi:MAG: hypothetical protein ACI4ES_00720 [Roseburia sp.]